jgi:hypothetical protein
MVGQNYHLLGSKPWRIKSSDEHVISNPKSAASVYKICARMSHFLLALRYAAKIREFWQFTLVNAA